MKVRSVLATVGVGGVLAAAVFMWKTFALSDPLDAKVSKLQAEVVSQRNELLGYTKYTDYLYAGKEKLQEQMKFIAATVVRRESYTRKVNKSILGMNSNAIVSISYTAEYSFGYMLKPNDYEITATQRGIEVTLRKPVLITSPATRDLGHEVLSDGVFTNSKAAIIHLFQGIDQRTLQSGRVLASDPAVVALCEKTLLAFLRDFFAKQPGVKHIPNITITYKT